MNGDIDFVAWRRQWQSGPEVAGAPDEEYLKQGIERQSRRMRRGLVAPFLVTIAIGGHILIRALNSQQSMDVLVAVEGWIFIIVVWVSSLWLARGTWRPLGRTTAAFVDLAIRRCRSDLRVSRVGMWIYAAQLLTVCLMVSQAGTSPSTLTAVLTSWSVIVIGWIGLPAYVVWLRWFQRIKRAELARLLEMQEQLTQTDA